MEEPHGPEKAVHSPDKQFRQMLAQLDDTVSAIATQRMRLDTNDSGAYIEILSAGQISLETMQPHLDAHATEKHLDLFARGRFDPLKKMLQYDVIFQASEQQEALLAHASEYCATLLDVLQDVIALEMCSLDDPAHIASFADTLSVLISAAKRNEAHLERINPVLKLIVQEGDQLLALCEKEKTRAVTEVETLLMLHGSAVQREEIAEHVLNKLPSDERHQVPAVVEGVLTKTYLHAGTLRPHITEINHIVEHFLHNHGLPQSVAHDWSQAVEQTLHRLGISFAHNMWSIQEVSSMVAPEAPALLHSQYGISNFARYPVELLRDQYELRDSSEVPYGVLIAGKRDHNGALLELLPASLDELGTTLEEHDVHLRIVEADSKVSLARLLRRLDQKNEGKFAFGIIVGHGSADSITLGSSEVEGNTLEVGDLADERFEVYRDLYAENAPILSFACKTGEEGGLMQRLAEQYDVEAIGATGSLGYTEFRLNKNQEGDFFFETEVYQGEGVEMRVYNRKNKW